MRRFVVVASLVVSAAACVNLDKPPLVADCATKGTCANASPDAPISPNPDVGPGNDVKNDGPASPLDMGIYPDVVPSDGDAPPAQVDVSLEDGPTVVDGPEGPRDLIAPDVPLGICSVGGAPKPAGTPCRPAVDLCDVTEVCDGISLDCPADKLASAATPCRPVAGDCDIAETCDGTSTACPVNGFKAAGTVCRKAADVCDVAESCDGLTAACPIDSVAPSTAPCRASTDKDQCDPTENCNGTSVECPADLKYTRPPVPTGITTTGGESQVTVAWTASTGATGYNVKQSLTSGRGYTTLVSSPTTTKASFTDTSLAGGTTYYYVVSAINAIPTCESADSSEASAKTTGTCVAPAAPVITAKPANGSVTLTWAAVADAVSYTVARSQTSGTGYSTIGTVKTGATFTDANVVNGMTYYYVVTASNGSCSSANSNEASTAPACTPPAEPTGLTATAGNGSATLKWAAVTGAVSYSIYRNSTGLDPFTFVNSTTQLTFTDSNVVNDTKYYYVVRASNGSCASGNSTVASVTPACIPPAPPTGVTVTPGDKQNALSWTAPTGATGYRVSRNTTGTGVFTQVGTPTTTNYTDKLLTNGTAYYYVVAASNGSCWSADSAVATGTPACTPPAVPGALTATPGDGKVSLSWGASTGGATVYTIWRKIGADGVYTSIGTATSTAYSDNSLTNGVTYYYKITAGNGSCDSGYNTERSATPVAACGQTQPTNVIAAPSGSVQVTVTWDASTPTPTTYSIGRSTTSGSGYVSIGSVLGTVLTYTDTDTTLLRNTTYYYQVTANGTCTATSAEVSATTVCANPEKVVPTPTANADGSITVQWPIASGATAYVVSRSSDGTNYSVVSPAPPPPLTATSYKDASGLVNGSNYFYKVTSSNANGQCTTDSDATAAVRSCIAPAKPEGLKAIRSGNKQVTLTWTASSGTNVTYRIQRGTTSNYATSTTASYVDNAADNGTAFTYSVVAVSDSSGNCSSAASATASVPSCKVMAAGESFVQLTNVTTEWCVVSCNDISSNNGWAGAFSCESRTFYFNGTQRPCSQINVPAKSNGGYVYYFTAASDGGYTGVNWGNGTPASCP
jgi:fibronectin type 3 domain-containing protein